MAFRTLLSLITFASIVAADFPDCVNGPLANTTVCDTDATTQARAQALIDLLTFEEKVLNTQNESPGVPRIGLPPYDWWNEASHGVATAPGTDFAAVGSDYSYATSFPQPILMGAAFDDELIYEVGATISTEARAFSNGNLSGLNWWTPNINPYRDPRWGRGQETPGEDAFHLSRYVDQMIAGLQGARDAQPYRKADACCKHYAGNDLDTWGGTFRTGYDAIISPQDLREYYLLPFQQCARDSKVQSIMCSYNAVNGVPTCANDYILKTILRDHWNWNLEDQYVVSDCGAVQYLYNASRRILPATVHNYTKTPEEAVAVALNAGVDLDCGNFYPAFLGGAYNQGLFDISKLDKSLLRRYSSLLNLGYFDPPANQLYRQLTFRNVSTKETQKLALRAAEEGIALLKNDGTLPLSPNTSLIAVIGPWATATTQMQGNYAGIAPYLHSPLDAAQAAKFSVMYAQGVDINSTNTTGFAAAIAIAQKADVVLFVGGIDNSVEAEARDRYNIAWPENQLKLITQLATLSKPLIVVQMGTMVDDSPLLTNPGVNGLLWGGYPGQDGGVAIMNIVTGKTSPAGRLPVTQHYASFVDEVPMNNQSLRPYQSTNYSLNNPGRTYKWYQGKSVFEFGYGLHYTTFSASISKMHLNSTYAISDLLSNTTAEYTDLTHFATVVVNVTNIGARASDYVALGFLAGSFGPKPFPNKSLVAYKRLFNISAGESQLAPLSITIGNLARVDEEGNLMLYPGNYGFVVDVDARTVWNFTLTGEPKLIDSWPSEALSVR